jgi:predicted CoA-binding protein
MAHVNPSDAELQALLTSANTIAVVGASSNPQRPSNGVMQRLLSAGYRVIPVNPGESEVLGQKAYASLLEIREPVDIVDVFRRPEYTPELADQALAINAKLFWLQHGIVNQEAADRARAGGLPVVMDSCIAVTLALLRIPKKTA